MDQNNYQIRPLQREEIALAIDWAAAEGWNPGLDDAPAFYAADPEGFLVGLLDGQPIAVISAVRYGSNAGFIGFYIVRPDYRGQGYGWQIWQAAMSHLAGRSIGLDGVIAQQANYAKSGFVLAWRNIRQQGQAGGELPQDPALIPLAGLNIEEILAYDQAFFPAERQAFLQEWLSQPAASVFGLRGKDGELSGYGMCRPCRAGSKIGPLFADTAAGADLLFRALQASAPAGTPLFLDTPESNPDACALAARHGLSPVFETARMYAGSAPELPVARIYGITSFELG